MLSSPDVANLLVALRGTVGVWVCLLFHRMSWWKAVPWFIHLLPHWAWIQLLPTSRGKLDSFSIPHSETFIWKWLIVRLQAVCCSDKAHCCPSGYRCNLATMMCEKTDQPWVSLPMLTKEAAEEPPALDLSTNLVEELKNDNGLAQKSTGVQCDSFYMCPDRTTCCRHPKGAWFCCPYYPVSRSLYIQSLYIILFNLSFHPSSTKFDGFFKWMHFLVGKVLSGWIPLLPVWLWLWLNVHSLYKGWLQISILLQTSSDLSPSCPHFTPRGEQHPVGGKEYFKEKNVCIASLRF